MRCDNAALQVGEWCAEAKELVDAGLKTLCEKLGIPPVLSYGTCTDTGRIVDIIHAVSGALAFGLYTHVNPVHNVTGGPDLVKLLTQDLSGVTGGLLNVEQDAGKAADDMLGHIESKCPKLGL